MHAPSPRPLTLSVSPSGRLRAHDGQADDGAYEGPHLAAIREAFDRGPGAGVLHLGAVEIETVLPVAYVYFRELGHEFVARARAHPELETAREKVRLDLPLDRLAAMAAAAPPIEGAEYVTAASLAALWSEVNDAFGAAIAAFSGKVADWLLSRSPAWATVGRICFHLAENKRDPDSPFAFLATYTSRLSARGAPQHRPLGRALEEHRDARDREGLLALLLPVQRAAEKSALVRGLVDSGEIYQPQAWTAREAHAFLKEIPVLESAGVTVRVPDWWSARNRSRAVVRVTVGGRTPSKLGTEAILDFSAELALDGAPLSAEERRAILGATDGLVLIKGRWVEANGDRLREVLAHWKHVEETAAVGGVSFHEAMRLVTGAAAALGEDSEAPEDTAAWSRVEAGPWMHEVLGGLRSPEALHSISPGGELQASLRAYQRVGAEWLWWAHELGLGVCLADDMGLGKTLQVLAMLLVRKQALRKPGQGPTSSRPALLVVPASLVANWKSEASRFTPGLRLLVAHAGSTSAAALASLTTEDVDVADAVLTTYASVTRVEWIRQRQWGLVILDEAQAIKNPGAKQTRAIKALAARARLALTGTPVENRLGDLWSLFDFLAPGLLGTAGQFSAAAKKMAKMEDGYAPLRRLVGPYILRRLKTDKRVIADLPDKTEVTAYCGLTKPQAALYQKAVAELQATLASTEEDSAMARRGAILAALLRFKQICNHPSQLLGDGVWSAEASGKFARLRELCEPIVARQEKLLVFTQFREMTEPLAAFLGTVFGKPGLVLHGSVPVKARKALVDAFQDEGGPPFFVLSLKAGGTGLTLTAASHVVHFDRWWNPAVENQATDRAFRIGQKKNVLVHKFVCRGTLEERIDELITSKRALADAVVGDRAEAGLTELSNEEILRMVTLDLKTAMSE